MAMSSPRTDLSLLMLAQATADNVDWHQVATLVRRGCPPRLALQIVR
jgi:hypothetical protein